MNKTKILACGIVGLAFAGVIRENVQEMQQHYYARLTEEQKQQLEKENLERLQASLEVLGYDSATEIEHQPTNWQTEKVNYKK